MMIYEWSKFKGWVVLEYFLKNPNTRVYIKELSRTLEISPRTAQEYLKHYERDGVLKSEAVGNAITYSLDNEHFLVKNLKKAYFLMQVNERDLQGFADQNDVVSLAVYGSYAEGDYMEKSDIDVLVISSKKDIDLEALRPLESVFGAELDVHVYSLGDWRRLCRENREFTEEVRSSRVLVFGAEI